MKLINIIFLPLSLLITLLFMSSCGNSKQSEQMIEVIVYGKLDDRRIVNFYVKETNFRSQTPKYYEYNHMIPFNDIKVGKTYLVIGKINSIFVSDVTFVKEVNE